jgi:hypothetical protein
LRGISSLAISGDKDSINGSPPMKHRSKAPNRAILWMVALSVTLLAAIFPMRADAHVLQGPYILELSAKAMGRIAALQVKQKLIVYPPKPEEAPVVFDETAIYVMPQRFRSDIVSDQFQRTHLEFGNSSLTVIDGRVATGKDPFDSYQRVLRSRTRSRLMRTLNDLGVETAISSLGRVEETVVFVLGAHYPDESVTQLAVDKETFLPVRLLLVDGEADGTGQRLDIRYLNWRKIQDSWFPMQVMFYTGEHLVREIRVGDLRLNPSIPSGLMDLEALKASAFVSDAESPQEQKQETVKAVQEAVQDFQKKFE